MNRVVIIAILAVSIIFCAELDTEYKKFKKTLLLNADNNKLHIEELEPNTPYIFSYPYRGTPSIIIKTETLDESNQTEHKVVSYLAINPNTYDYVNNDISTLSFYKNEVFGNDVLRFCDDKETYHIDSGINILDYYVVPELQVENVSLSKLEKVILKIDEDNKIYAVGLSDDEVIRNFFKEKKRALTKRFRSIWSAKKTYSKVKTVPMDEFSLVTVKCNNKKPLIIEDINNSDENVSTYEEIIEEAM